jgi:hypothetical protein
MELGCGALRGRLAKMRAERAERSENQKDEGRMGDRGPMQALGAWSSSRGANLRENERIERGDEEPKRGDLRIAGRRTREVVDEGAVVLSGGVH